MGGMMNRSRAAGLTRNHLFELVVGRAFSWEGGFLCDAHRELRGNSDGTAIGAITNEPSRITYLDDHGEVASRPKPATDIQLLAHSKARAAWRDPAIREKTFELWASRAKRRSRPWAASEFGDPDGRYFDTDPGDDRADYLVKKAEAWREMHT